MAIIFDGYKMAKDIELQLTAEVAQLKKQGVNLCIASVLFTEDSGSVLYTQLKKEAAGRIGIDYQVQSFSLKTDVNQVIKHLHQLNTDQTVTGIIIQKPWRQTWQQITTGSAQDFQVWWQTLTQAINPAKDVDGLHPETMMAIKNHTWRQEKKVLPATCRAVLDIMTQALDHQELQTKKVVILGKSDLLGQPLFYELKNRGCEVEMIGSAELTERVNGGVGLRDADIIVSATGRRHLITGEMIKTGAIVIDVGEPQPDVDFASVSPKAAFITPVPGGVGPMTVISLMKNCVQLI